ncbi:hypothetical protein V495_06356 [Pseudogymnoascus sp. VKM F-4514 (FW-929)]|nr:hypothetical protein V495_06356 [Pseudogymnoascus sp. VKM F-4514 (FW-929)]KFY68086.1 hypothetical protein V497_00026 [Pseudogymnoascus sp. VKM F-4516 (FW-969)]
MSFRKLTRSSYTLLNLLEFLEPDGIDNAVLAEGSKGGLNPPDWGKEFDFLSDEMESLANAEAALLQAGFIGKGAHDKGLLIDGAIQASVIRELSKDNQSKYFDAAVRIVTCGFLKPGAKTLGTSFKPGRNATNTCPMYLYEREWYTMARNFINTALEKLEDKTSLAFASAVDLSGLIDLDMNNPFNALVQFTLALKVRENLLKSEDPLLASSFNNIALSYTEMGDLDVAYSAHEKALSIRLREETRVDNTYSNMSSLLLRMGKSNEAKEMMKKSPALKDFTDDSFINTENPRYVGNMVLLSRIRLAQGRLDDAMRLASKALAFRQKFQGNRLKTCDSMYDVAGMLIRQGRLSEAIELLKQLVDLSETLAEEAEGQLARANYKLSVLYGEKEMSAESQACKSRAISLRDKLRPESKDSPFQEPEFMKPCLFMLW